MRTVASAPGKVILMGEHAAVYGHPALVAAVDRRTTATLTASPSPSPSPSSSPSSSSSPPPSGWRVTLDLPAVGVAETVTWDAIHAYTRACRAAWERYRDDPTPERFAAVRGEDPAHLVKIALGECAAYLGEDLRGGRDLTLCVTSTIPVGSGFGSSAAVAASVVWAFLAAHGRSPRPEDVEPIVLAIERRQHGMPSGVDGATVLRGGLVWASRNAGGVLEVEPLPAAAAALAGFSIYQTGVPAESTGAVVAAVRRRRAADPGAIDAVLEDMATATTAFRDWLVGAGPPAEGVALIRRFQRALERLGVVPEAVARAVRAVERAGGAAKISGAGALSGTGAGSLLVYDPGTSRGAAAALAGLERLEARLGAAGIRSEPSRG